MRGSAAEHICNAASKCCFTKKFRFFFSKRHVNETRYAQTVVSMPLKKNADFQVNLTLLQMHYKYAQRHNLVV